MRFITAVGLALAIFCTPLAGMAAESSPVGTTVQNFTLKDYRGKSVSLADYSESKAVVLVFLGTECPLAKLYGPRLAELAATYEPQGVAFLGVNANVQDSITEIAAHARLHQIEFPVVKDLGNEVADAIGAVRTPEVFVLDEKRVVRYWGRIDDQYGVGFIREKPTRQDLQIALDELLAGKDISMPVATAVGCHIGRIQKPDPQATVTYSNQISRLLQKRCVECHREGEIAPFALTDYEEVVGWAETIAETVQQNRMPPWHASAEHGRFLNDRHLSKDEKQLIYDWVDAGAPEGDPKELPPSLEYQTGWQLPQKPDLVVNMRKAPFKVQAEGTVRYQYFVADADFKEDRWMKAAEVMPGNRAVVHHVLVFAKSPGQRLNERGFLAGYVPGLRARPLPDGMAKRIPAGSQLVFQVHYTPIGSEQLDMSKIGFLFVDREDVEYEVRTDSADTKNIRIAPHEENYQAEATSGSVDVEVKLLSLMPHMHLRGKSFRYELIGTDGKRETLLDVPNYDFNWQTSYRLEEPLVIPPGAKLHCEATYDNSENNVWNPDPNQEVRWGPQTWDEMLFGYFDYAIKVGAMDDPIGYSPAQIATARGIIRQLDTSGDGQISRGETPRRFLKKFDELDRDENGQVTFLELLQGG